MLWYNFLQFLCPRMMHTAPGDTGWLYDSHWGGICSLEQVYRTWRWIKLPTVGFIWLVWSKWIIVGLLWKVIKEVLLKNVCLSQNVFWVLEKHGDVGDEVVFNVPFLWFSGEYLKFRVRNTYIGSCLLFFVRTSDFLTIYCHFHVKGTAGQCYSMENSCSKLADILH